MDDTKSTTNYIVGIFSTVQICLDFCPDRIWTRVPGTAIQSLSVQSGAVRFLAGFLFGICCTVYLHASCVLQPASIFLCPASCILCLMSYVLCPMSYIQYTMSYILFPMSYFLQHISCILLARFIFKSYVNGHKCSFLHHMSYILQNRIPT